MDIKRCTLIFGYKGRAKPIRVVRKEFSLIKNTVQAVFDDNIDRYKNKLFTDMGCIKKQGGTCLMLLLFKIVKRQSGKNVQKYI